MLVTAQSGGCDISAGFNSTEVPMGPDLVAWLILVVPVACFAAMLFYIFKV